MSTDYAANIYVAYIPHDVVALLELERAIEYHLRPYALYRNLSSSTTNPSMYVATFRTPAAVREYVSSTPHKVQLRNGTWMDLRVCLEGEEPPPLLPGVESVAGSPFVSPRGERDNLVVSYSKSSWDATYGAGRVADTLSSSPTLSRRESLNMSSGQLPFGQFRGAGGTGACSDCIAHVQQLVDLIRQTITTMKTLNSLYQQRATTSITNQETRVNIKALIKTLRAVASGSNTSLPSAAVASLLSPSPPQSVLGGCQGCTNYCDVLVESFRHQVTAIQTLVTGLHQITDAINALSLFGTNFTVEVDALANELNSLIVAGVGTSQQLDPSFASPPASPRRLTVMAANTQPTGPPRRLSNPTSTEVQQLLNALNAEIHRMDRSVHTYQKVTQANASTMRTTSILHKVKAAPKMNLTTVFRRCSDGLALANTMVRQNLSHVDYQKLWVNPDSKKKVSEDLWEWALRLCGRRFKPGETGAPVFFYEDLHCGFCDDADDPDGYGWKKHRRRNPIELDEPPICCVWQGFRDVVARHEREPHVLEDVVKRGLAAGWSMPALAQGVFAVFLYTFEVKCIPMTDTEKSESRYDTHYGYVNSTLRRYANPLSQAPPTPALSEEKEKALNYVRPFVEGLQTFLLECLPTVGDLETYRGIDLPVARLYITGQNFVWSAFSSTSRLPRVAMDFAKVTLRQGSFFQLNVSSGRDISMFSMFPKEAEVLLPVNTAFVVGNRLSETLLLQSGFASDMVVAMEIRSASDTQLAQPSKIDWRLRSIRSSHYLYEPVKKKYVTPRIGLIDHCAEDQLHPLFGVDSAVVLPWVAPDVPFGSTVLLLADGGMGKTMTCMRLFSHVLETAPTFTPVFVPLPQVLRYRSSPTNSLNTSMTASELQYTSLLEFMLDFLVIDESEGQDLLERRLVVFLDSLDEVSIDVAALTTDVRVTLHDVLGLSQWVNSIFVIACRREVFTTRLGHSDISPRMDVWYLRSPGKEAIYQLGLQVAQSDESIPSDEAQNIAQIVAQTPMCLSNPFVATLAAEALSFKRDIETLDLWNTYNLALQKHYHGPGLSKAWNTTVERAVSKFFVFEVSVEAKKKWMSERAFEFGIFLALHTYMDGTWPVGIDVRTYKYDTNWVDVLTQWEHANKPMPIELATIFKTPALLQAWFDMQPLRSESLEHGVWSFRHRTIHEHLIAHALLLSYPQMCFYALANPTATAIVPQPLYDIPLKHHGIVHQCVALLKSSLETVDQVMSHLLSQKKQVGTTSALCATLLSRYNRSILSGLDLSYSDLRGANLLCAQLWNTNLRRSKLDGAELQHVEFRGTTSVRDCTFYHAHTGIYPTLVGHEGTILSLTTSPDGKYIYSASADESIRMWCAEGWSFVKKFVGHKGPVTCIVCFENNPDRILSSSVDKSVKVWNVTSGKDVVTVKSHGIAVTAVALSFDGTLMASASEDNTAKVFILKTFAQNDDVEVQEVTTIRGHNHHILCVTFNRDGKMLVTGSADHTVMLWSGYRFKQLSGTLVGHKGPVNSMCLSDDGKRLATASADKTVKIWNLELCSETFTLSGHSFGVLSVYWSSDDRYIVTGSKDHSIKLWSTSSQKAVATLNGHSNDVNAVRMTSKFVISGSSDKTVRLWDSTLHSDVEALIGHNGAVRCCACVQPGVIATGGHDRVLRFWSCESLQEVSPPLDGHTQDITCVSCFDRFLTEDKLIVATGSEDSTVRIWTCKSGMSVKEGFTSHVLQGHTHTVTGVLVTESYIFSCSKDKTIRVWNHAGEEVSVIAAHSYYINCMCGTRSGDKIITGSEDKTVKIWSGHEPFTLLATLQGNTDFVSAMVIDSDEAVLYTASGDGFIRVWSLYDEYKMQHAFAAAQLTFVVSLAVFNAIDGEEYLIAGLETGAISLFEIRKDHHRYFGSLQGHSQWVHGLCIVDALTLVSVSRDCSIKVWDLNDGSMDDEDESMSPAGSAGSGGSGVDLVSTLNTTFSSPKRMSGVFSPMIGSSGSLMTAAAVAAAKPPLYGTPFYKSQQRVISNYLA
eukprot:PhF_6_TR42956/c0_g1_i1/m.65345